MKLSLQKGRLSHASIYREGILIDGSDVQKHSARLVNVHSCAPSAT